MTVSTENTPEYIARRNRAISEAEQQHKSVLVAFIFWFLLGIVGGHRFYLQSYGIAVGQLLTVGGLGVWSLIDAFFIASRVREYNQQISDKVNARYGVLPA